jgi:hypothetical protein
MKSGTGFAIGLRGATLEGMTDDFGPRT